MTTELTTRLPMLLDPARFEQAQRVGKMMALSPLFPEHLRKGGLEVALANAVLVQDMADRLTRPPLEVAQNIYFVAGKPGWSTSYLIGLANESGKLKKPINWDVKGSGDNLAVRAFAELKSGAKIEYTVTMEMAKAEQWTKNPKYRTMPELMLRYRSATALIRLYMPEITMGVPSMEEAQDPHEMRDITPTQTSAAPAESGDLVAEAVDGEVLPPEDEKPKAKPKAEEKPKAKPKAKEPEPEPEAVSDEGTRHDPETGEVREEPSEEDVERHVQLKDMILSEIDACDDIGMLDGVLDMYGPQIEQLTGFDEKLGEEIGEKVESRRGELSE